MLIALGADLPTRYSSAQPQPRKPLEPYEVPTAGAFFMHDDRFGGEAGKPGCSTATALQLSCQYAPGKPRSQETSDALWALATQ